MQTGSSPRRPSPATRSRALHSRRGTAHRCDHLLSRIFPEKLNDLRGAQPILALTPTPGDVDVVIASELVEAGRAIQNGFVTPTRTTLIASTSRIYAIAERAAMADGRFDSGRIMAAAQRAVRAAVLFDVNALMKASGSPVNAILFGALIPRRRCRLIARLRKPRYARPARLRRAICAVSPRLRTSRSRTGCAGRPLKSARRHSPRLAWLISRCRRTKIIAHGVQRLLEYQSGSYAQIYLDRLATDRTPRSRR